MPAHRTPSASLKEACFFFLIAALAAFANPRGVWAAGLSPERGPLWLGDSGVDVAAARARHNETHAAWLRWEQANLDGDYERFGKKDPRWDADVHACLDAFAQAVVVREEDAKALVAAARAAGKRAVAAGCDDPLFRYVALRVAAIPVDGSATINAQRYAEAEANLEKTGYSIVIKCYASLRAGTNASDALRYERLMGKRIDAVPGADPAASLERAFTHLVEALRDPTIPSGAIHDLTNNVVEAAQKIDLGPTKILQPLERAFGSGGLKDAKETATLRMAEGIFWMQYGFSSAEQLQKAQTALEKAYALDPSESLICNCMLAVERGLSPNRERMETWFRRAMNADPDDYVACQRKMYYLESQSYGSKEGMLKFGRQCVATRNWQARLPWLLEDAHQKLAKRAFDQSETEYKAYWKWPATWRDMELFYEAAMAAQPDSATVQSGYASAAYDAEQWKLLCELLAMLGDKVDVHAIGGSDRLEAIRREVAEQVQQAKPEYKDN